MHAKTKHLVESLYTRIELFSKRCGVWIDSKELLSILCDTSTWEHSCIGVDKVLNVVFTIYLNKITGRKTLILRILKQDTNATAENQVPFLYQLLRYCTKDKDVDNYFLDYIVENIVAHCMLLDSSTSIGDIGDIRKEYFNDTDNIDLRIYLNNNE